MNMDPEFDLQPPPVLLSWTDSDSGEELCILVHGPPEFLSELRSQGFEPGRVFDRDGLQLPTPRVVVAFRG
jgi:hypothetical protein